MQKQLGQHHFLVFLLVIGLCVAIPLLISASHHPSFYDADGHYYGQDFINYWGAPQLAAKDIMQLFDVARYNEGLDALHGTVQPKHNWSYPLHMLPFVGLFGALPLITAFIAWSLLGLIVYATLIYRYAPEGRARWAVIAAVLSPATLCCLVYGQNGLFTATLFLLALKLLAKRPVLAGISLGFLTFKPQLGLIWPLIILLHRRFALACVAGLTTCLLVGLSLALYGYDAWVGYLANAAKFQWETVREPIAHRIFETMMPTFIIALQKLGFSSDMAYTMHMVIALIIAVLLAIELKKSKVFDSRLTLLIACGASLLTPYLFNYDLTLLTAALIWHLLASPPKNRLSRLIYALAYLTPVLVYVFYFTLPLAPFILLALFFTVRHEGRIAVRT